MEEPAPIEYIYNEDIYQLEQHKQFFYSTTPSFFLAISSSNVVENFWLVQTIKVTLDSNFFLNCSSQNTMLLVLNNPVVFPIKQPITENDDYFNKSILYFIMKNNVEVVSKLLDSIPSITLLGGLDWKKFFHLSVSNFNYQMFKALLKVVEERQLVGVHVEYDKLLELALSLKFVSVPDTDFLEQLFLGASNDHLDWAISYSTNPNTLREWVLKYAKLCVKNKFLCVFFNSVFFDRNKNPLKNVIEQFAREYFINRENLKLIPMEILLTHYKGLEKIGAPINLDILKESVFSSRNIDKPTLRDMIHQFFANAPFSYKIFYGLNKNQHYDLLFELIQTNNQPDLTTYVKCIYECVDKKQWALASQLHGKVKLMSNYEGEFNKIFGSVEIIPHPYYQTFLELLNKASEIVDLT